MIKGVSNVDFCRRVFIVCGFWGSLMILLLVLVRFFFVAYDVGEIECVAAIAI